MVGCCVSGCSNRSEKGFSMKRFPKNIVRRKTWTEQINRKGWYPTVHSAVCEVHFEPSMWEKIRIDGKRKLRLNAIPTIFPTGFKTGIRKSPRTRATSNETVTEYLKMKVEDSSENIEEHIFKSEEVLESSYSLFTFGASDTAEAYPFIYNEEKYDAANEKLLPQNPEYNEKQQSQSFCITNIVANNVNLNTVQADEETSLKWCDATTIKNALKLKFICENNHYEKISNQNNFLPSLKYLTEHLFKLNFEGGILNEVLDIFKLKLSNITSDTQRDCVIFLKEIPILSADIYNASKDKCDNMALNKHCGLATHILVVAVGGISIYWKQIIGFYFTGNFVNTSLYKDIILKVIAKVEELDLKVLSITSDIESSREVIWKNWNITMEYDMKITNYITHPFDSSRKIFILGDITSLYKNFKLLIMGNKNIMIPNHLQKPLDPSNLQNEHVSLSSTLTQKELQSEKVRQTSLSSSTVNFNIIDDSNFALDNLEKTECKTTAWLIATVEKWFAVMSSSNSAVGLNKQNSNTYNKEISFLKEFVELLCQIQICGKVWKPYTQIGLILSTQSVLDIQNLLFNQKGYTVLPTSRLTLHCLTNLDILNADAIQLKNALKKLCVLQLLTTLSDCIDEQTRTKLLLEILVAIKK